MLNKKISLSLFALIASGFVLSACNKYVAATDKKIETTLERVEEYMQQAQIPDLPEPTDTVRSRNDIWLGNQSVKIMAGDALPPEYEKDDGVTIAIAEDAKLSDVLQQVTDLTEIPIHLDDLKAENAVPEESVPVRYTGKLSGLLNYLSNRYNIYWKYKDRMITFFTKETRVFTIFALPTKTSMSASLSGASMGGEGGGSGSLSVDTDLDVWSTIKEGVEQVAGGDAKLAFSQPAGTITVTATPHIIRKVAAYIAGWNDKLSRQVAITVRLLQVTLNNSDNYGLNLKTVFQTNGRHLEGPATFTSKLADASGASLAMTILSGNWTITPTINALSTQGKTRLLYTATATVLNNKVAPINVTTKRNYIKEVTVTRSGSSDNQTTDVDREVEELTYGLVVNVLPRILDQGRLMLMFSLSLTDLVNLERSCDGSSTDTTNNDNTENNTTNGGTEEGGNTNNNTNADNNTTKNDSDSEQSCVQLPEMTQTGFLQEVAMRSGNTLVLSGFERQQDTTNSSGVGKPKIGLLGGSAVNDSSRQVLVVLITPEVLQSPLSQEALMRDY
ncbi:MAG: hypothetical protein J6Y85_05720 [Alphaproteobacteria bacterium]|nr:hypothetical protein [Alphaproteobacteria bacterium]